MSNRGRFFFGQDMGEKQMGNIVLLDDLTINKIAAGEVVERPASVIKEMVENSIDAGATNITVEIRNGGISFIKITDNGKGIAQDDLEIAFERHATSKIRSADDLDTVTSMGFRGEALASIAAIANVELISKTAEQENGYRIVVEAGNILEKEISASSVGTTITVKNLFFNTPVRYKFLKKDYTESAYIEDVITRESLVNLNIAFKLINTGKTVIQTNGNGDLKSVIYSIYGKNVAESVMPVSYTYEDIQVDGMVGKAEIARSNRVNQLFFVNKRYIKDKTLSSATEQAYKGMIPLGKFGFVILNITMDPAKVDVNVHPAKLEVRFQEESKIFQAIYHAIKDTLLKNGENTGLFGLRKSDEKEIENYTNEESKIKTNVVEKTDYNIGKDLMQSVSENVDSSAIQYNNLNLGRTMNTNDILAQLNKLKEDMQKELKSGSTVIENTNLSENLSTDMQKNVENPDVQENLKEKPVITQDANTEQKIDKISIIDTLIGLKNIENRLEDSGNPLKHSNSEIQVVSEQENAEKNPEENLQENEQKNNEEEQYTYDKTMCFDEMYQKLFGRAPIKQEQKDEKKENNAVDLIKDNVSVFEGIEEYQKQPYKFIGIIFNTYIIIEMNNEMYIIDQHAAHERIMYEKVKKNYYNDSSKDSQMLLLPDVITLTHKEMAIARENMEMFAKAGFSLEEFGENTIKLTGVPTVCIEIDNKDLFLETLDEINTVARTAKQEKEEKFIATVACKAAVKANMALTREEVESLMDKLLELPNPFSCPHGRPTAIKMTKYDIERKFARK